MNNTEINYYAFFDVDGTLIKGTPMLSFLKYFYQKTSRLSLVGRLKYSIYVMKTKVFMFIGKNREFLNRHYYECYKNIDIKQISDLGEKWFYESVHNPAHYLTTVIEEMKAHQRNGGEVVLVSGSFYPCLKTFANKFNIKNILATNLEVKDKKYTGKIVNPQTIGLGKALVIKDFLNRNNFTDYKKCFAYGDHSSDVEMLSLVGNPKVVSGDSHLEQYAITRGWEIVFV